MQPFRTRESQAHIEDKYEIAYRAHYHAMAFRFDDPNCGPQDQQYDGKSKQNYF